MKPFYFLFFCICFLGIFRSATAQDQIKLEGRILSAENKEPVPYAAIGFPEKGLGTVCDENGNFELKLPTGYKNLELCVSALGYKQNCQLVSGFSAANPTVLLQPANLELATVEIKALSASGLVKEAIRRIPENYADKPVRYTFYQRQMDIKNDRPAYIIESVNEAWRNHPKKGYQLSIKKTRGMATSKKNREEMNDTWVSVYSILSHTDIGKYRPYLHPSKFRAYSYQFEEDDLIGADTVYVVSFKPKLKKNGEEVAGTEGKLFIHNRTKAIIRMEGKDNKAAIEKENNSFLLKAANKLEGGELKFEDGMGISEYKKIGNRWYFNNFHTEHHSQIREKNNSVADRYFSIRQLVVTDIQIDNAPQIPENERVQRFGNYYSTAPKDMNEAFWQQYNVLPLPDAYKNAK